MKADVHVFVDVEVLEQIKRMTGNVSGWVNDCMRKYISEYNGLRDRQQKVDVLRQALLSEEKALGEARKAELVGIHLDVDARDGWFVINASGKTLTERLTRRMAQARLEELKSGVKML
jgi:hypothetical protein